MTWRWNDLTSREKQIALLAAEGYKDMAISLRLNISTSHVAKTLTTVYRILDVGNRTEMAFLLGQHLREIEQSNVRRVS